MNNNYEPEVWVDLKDAKLEGTEYKYQVSSYGRVWNKETSCFVSPVLTGIPSYWYVNLRVGCIRKLRRVHYLQAYSFYGEPPIDDTGSVKRQTCDHIDINRYNNSLYNLRWLDRKGQSYNRRERTDTLLYRVKQDYTEGCVSKQYEYIRSSISRGFSYKEAKTLLRQKVESDGKELLVTLNNRVVNFYYLCKIFNKDVDKTYKLHSNGYSLEDLFTKLRIKEKDISQSYEIDGTWYPTKVSIRSRYKLKESEVDIFISKGGIESYLKYKQHKEYVKSFTKELWADRQYGVDWGDNLFGTVRGLARKYKVQHGNLWYRVNKGGMTMKEALDAPNGNINHHWYINNRWCNKKELCESLGTRVSSVTKRLTKGDDLKYALLPLAGKRDVIFNINGNIYSKLDISLKWEVSQRKLKLSEEYLDYTLLFSNLSIISKYDYFEVISRDK